MTTLLDSKISDKVRSAYPFSVEKFPLFGPDGMRTPHYGLFRSDSSASVGVACSKAYVPHTVDDICALVDAASGAFDGDIDVRCGWGDGHFVTVEPTRSHRVSIFGTSDNIWPRLIINAGYDGRAFRSSLGYYRDACRNMAEIRSAGQSVRSCIRHTHCLTDKLGELRVHFQTLAAKWDGVVETARTMQSTEVQFADFLRHVYPLREDASDRSRASFERRIEKIILRVSRERQATGRPNIHALDVVTGWEAFNAVQGYVQHDMTRRNQTDDMARALKALDDASVARALDYVLAA